MPRAQKYYVVWKGRAPGIYKTWAECERQIKGFPDADYKGKHISNLSQPRLIEIGKPILDSYAVDAACNGNPGVLEYRCVYTRTGRQAFREGPFEDGTNNVGEFLALVQALSSFKRKGIISPIYSDSETALSWLKDKRCKTKLPRTGKNEKLFRLIEQAESWLRSNSYSNKVLKWETEA